MQPQLGNLIQVYTPSKAGAVFTIIFSILLILGGITLFAVGVTPPPYGDTNSGATVELLGGIALLALGVFLIYRVWVNAALTVRVYVNGLVAISRRGTTIFPWDQIVAVWQSVTKHYTNGIYSGTSHSYTIQRGDGQKATFNDALRQVEGLGESIQKETFKYLFPQAVAAYNAGQPLYFGKLSISQQGISNGKELLGWNDIKSVRLNKGLIAVSKQGKWFNWSNATVAQTPNVFIFLSLVDHIKGLNR